MSIKEANLPVAEEVTSENLIRTVSGGGNSQNMTVEQLGGLVGDGKYYKLSLEEDDGNITFDGDFDELVEAVNEDHIIFLDTTYNTVIISGLFMAVVDDDTVFIFVNPAVSRFFSNYKFIRFVSGKLKITRNSSYVNSDLMDTFNITIS